jgi:hypothetical protein
MFTFVLFSRNDYQPVRLVYSAGQIAFGESAVAQTISIDLDPKHNAAIRREIGERLRVLLSKEQPKPPPRVQHLLDRLSELDNR